MAATYKALVNDLDEFEFTEKEIAEADLIKTGDLSYHLIRNNRSVPLRIEESDFHDRTYVISVGDERFKVKLSRPLDLFIEQMGFAREGAEEVKQVAAPMPGLLLDIYVEEGQEVEKDTPLLVLEAMKMENVILSPRTGIIAGIHAVKGASVEKGTELISFQ